MLVSLNEILTIAESEMCAIGAFNTPNLECVMAVLKAAGKLNRPVILNHAELHENVMPLEVIGPIMIKMASDADIPVCVHLDHGENLNYIKKALDLGFTSVMYDGSRFGFDENVKNTKKAVEIARHYGAGIEAEIGVLGGSEISYDNHVDLKGAYTDPDVAEQFVKETHIDALAASFGTSHGFYTSKPCLDYERIEQIRKQTNIPLVMHGGSGVSEESYREAIQRGVRKINYYSYMSLAGVNGVRDLLKKNDVRYFHDLSTAAVEAMSENVMQAICVFSMK